MQLKESDETKNNIELNCQQQYDNATVYVFARVVMGIARKTYWIRSVAVLKPRVTILVTSDLIALCFERIDGI